LFVPLGVVSPATDASTATLFCAPFGSACRRLTYDPKGM
jgi:hypothetical protein